jgi:hypothetical protein
MARGGALLLLATGLLLALTLALGLLAPLSIVRWPHVIWTSDPLAVALGHSAAGAARFAVTAVLLLAVYALALLAARRASGRLAALIALAGVVVFVALLLPLNPVGAHDVYHNVADARTLWLHGADPLVVPPVRYPSDPYLRFLPAWLGTPTGYGPLWYALAGAPLPFAGDGLWRNVIGQKLLVSLFLLLLTLTAMGLARRRGGNMALAGVAVGWNPLLLFETAGNAHNDAVMLTLAAAALWCALDRRTELWTFPLLALAVATKASVAVAAVPLAAWLLARPDARRGRIAVSLAAGAALLGAIYLVPPFTPLDLYSALRAESAHVTSSLGATLAFFLQNTLGAPAGLSSFALKAVAWSAFAGILAELAWRCRVDRSREAALRRCAWAVFWMLLLVRWWYMPWYGVWLLPLAVATRDAKLWAMALALAAGGLLMYLPIYWGPSGNGLAWDALTTLVAIGPALAVALF